MQQDSANHHHNQGQKYVIFLSHNSNDKPAVEYIAHQLLKEGIEPWLDKWNLIPGDPWQSAIARILVGYQLMVG